jgi:hypothetical protein
MKTGDIRTCLICGNEFSEAIEFCPVCMLRDAVAGGVESGKPCASGDTVKPPPEQAIQRFEHYELVTGEDGKPVALQWASQFSLGRVMVTGQTPSEVLPLR